MKVKGSGSTKSESISERSTEYRLEFAPRALGDIDEAVEWLRSSSQSPELAQRWGESLIENIRRLSFSPERCPLAPENEAWDEEVRHLLIGDKGSQFRIVFTVRPNVVRILTIRRSRRAAQ